MILEIISSVRYATALISLWMISTIAVSAEQVLEPWLPQHLDEWNALVEETNLYIKNFNEAQGKGGQPLKFHFDMRNLPIKNKYDLPIPPEDVSPDDIISGNLWVGKENPSTTCGYIQIWRALHKGAAGAVITYNYADKSEIRNYPDPAMSVPALKALEKSQKTSLGTWHFEVKTNGKWHTWVATWVNPEDRARVIDDLETDPEALKPIRGEDRQWLLGPPVALPVMAIPLMGPDTYTQSIASHSAIQRSLLLYRSQVPSRPVIVTRRLNERALADGFRAGDIPIELNGKTFATLEQFNSLWNEAGKGELEIRVARIGAAPITLKRSAMGIGFDSEVGLPEPGIAVLHEVGEINKDLITDAAAAMFALDAPEIAAEGLRRLENKVPVQVISFIRAWQAASRDDFGLVDALLDVSGAPPKTYLDYEFRTLKSANRQRSGRFYWAWPTEETTPGFDATMRRLVKSIPQAQRFDLFAGKVSSDIFTVNAIDHMKPLYGKPQAFSTSVVTLATTPAWRQERITYENLPAQCEMTCDFLVTPVIRAVIDSVFVPACPCLGIQLTTSYTDKGLGNVRVHPGGQVTFQPPTLSPASEDYEWEPVPIPVSFDGVTYNKLRIVRMAQYQRIEINGHVAMQGFIPLLKGIGMKREQTAGLLLIAQDAVCTFKNGRVFTTKEPSQKSNF